MRSRKWLKKTSKSTFRCLRWVLVLVICTLLYARVIEPNWIDINSLQLTLPHLSPEFNGYRIVQISDIHRDQLMSSRHLTRIVNLVNRQKPDLVAITGDLVTRNLPTYIPTLKVPLSQLKAKDKTVAVLGNHDYENDSDAIVQTIEQSGILHLGNCVYTLKRGSAMLHIAGVDDISADKDRLDLVLQQLPKEGAAILLAHEPDFADISAATKRFDLQLSGHSHGGQIRFPFFEPLILPSLSEKYHTGRYQVGEMIQYTNRGIGMSGVHLRLGARPEITVFTLVAPRN